MKFLGGVLGLFFNKKNDRKEAPKHPLKSHIANVLGGLVSTENPCRRLLSTLLRGTRFQDPSKKLRRPPMGPFFGSKISAFLTYFHPAGNLWPEDSEA